MGKFKVVYTDNIYKDNEIEFRRFKQLGYDFTVLDKHDEQSIIEGCRGADAVMISFIEMNENIINHLSDNCKVIVRCGMGINNVDIPAATRRGIMVANVQKYCLEEVSDHAMALMLTLIRKTASLSRRLREGVWNPAEARPIPRLSQTTLALYGLGGISSRFAVKAKALGMRVAAYDPFIPAEHFEQTGAERINDESELFRIADVLSVHLPLNASTAKIISKEKLALMKPTAIFINVARGSLVDEEALIEALKSGKLGGAGLDVLTDEPVNMDNPLLGMDNVIVTPHIAYYSEGSDADLRNYAIDQVAEALEQGEPRFILNKKELGRR